MRGAVVFLVLGGCGRFGFEDIGEPDAIGHDGDPDALGSDADAPCTFGPWGVATNAASANTSANDWSPTLSDDGLELIWETTRTGDQELYRAVRQTSAEPFGQAAALDTLSSPQGDASPTLTRDRLTIYFSSNRSGQWRLYRATRADKDAAFGDPIMVPELASVAVLGPAIAWSGDELVYTDLGESTLSRAVMTNGTFAVVGTMPELGTSASAYPDLSRDGLTIYFDRNSSELVSATRSEPGQPFSTPTPIAGDVSSGAGEADAELGDADRQLVFSSNRTGGMGSWDIWLVMRTCQ